MLSLAVLHLLSCCNELLDVVKVTAFSCISDASEAKAEVTMACLSDDYLRIYL